MSGWPGENQESTWVLLPIPAAPHGMRVAEAHEGPGDSREESGFCGKLREGSAREHRMPAVRVLGHDKVVYDRDSKEASGSHQLGGSCDIILARRRISRWMIVPYNESRTARRYGGPEDCARLDRANTVLPADGDDVGARDLELAVEKERGKVLAVGESNHCLERSCGALAVRDRLFGEAEGAAGLDKAHLVDWNRVKR